MIQTLKIGDVSLKNNLILAPMAGVTDLPFRLLCNEQGAGLLCMEMVSAKAIYFNNKNTEQLLTIDDREPPVSLQLFGSDPDIISEMAKKIENRSFSILDINMGCPVPKVAGNGEGSALMKNPKLVEEIVSKTAKAIKKPVTVKIRKGFDDEHINAVEIARIAVIDEMKRQGGGHALMLALKAWSKEHQIAKVLLDVRESNQAAGAFYAREGFVNDGVRKAFYQDPKEDAVLMSLEIDK